MRQIAVIDYGSGNLHSVVNAVRAAVSSDDGAAEVSLVQDADELRSADAIILPGVGHFADCRQNLEDADGMEDALNEMVRIKARPFLGICVGMQMLADSGYEGRAISGLGWIEGTVQKLTPPDHSFKIPHMGWNDLIFHGNHKATVNMSAKAQVYFVHSYHFSAQNNDDVIATTDYGQPVTALVAKDTMIGTQFHPEKSQAEGQAFLRGFLNWRP